MLKSLLRAWEASGCEGDVKDDTFSGNLGLRYFGVPAPRLWLGPTLGLPLCLACVPHRALRGTLCMLGQPVSELPAWLRSACHLPTELTSNFIQP